jgi:hypothetical protein
MKKYHVLKMAVLSAVLVAGSAQAERTLYLAG